MSLMYIALVTVIVGVLLWCVNQYIPMEAKIKKILNIVVVIGLVVWLLKAFGVWQYLSEIKVG